MELFTPTFKAYISVRLFLAIGWQIQALVVSWTVWEITRDPLMLGMVGLAEAVPAIGAALPLGYLVDKLEKRRVIKTALALMIISAICTGVLVQPQSIAYMGTEHSTTLLLAFIVVNGFARSLYSPAMFSTLSKTVTVDVLPKATAISSTAWQAAMVLGPLIGGLVYGQFGVLTAAVLTIVSMCVGGISSLWLPVIQPILSTTKGRLWDDVITGLQFIRSTHVLFAALALDMFAVLFGGAIALLPVFAKEILLVDASGLGVLRAAPSVGSVLTMVWLSFHPPVNKSGKKLLFAVTGFGIVTVGFALSTNFYISIVLLVLLGLLDGLSVVIRQTILQLFTPDEMRGRVAAVNTMFVSSSNEIGALESGVAAKLMGVVPSVIFGGVMTVLIVAGTAWKVPKLSKLELIGKD
ncbi:MAG: MFS transporter [Chlorobi bacterium]|nr:MAG: MFS transporter [Bacteroidota bacterium]KXK35818.1 MAG: major facilitator transporter [Chlorobi bacterium OLB6]MBL1160315.1 MFS transporter [Chlorobiota bacterium]MBZ0195512.1 MFS transporter [Candidatus Kapabacteria bacterium]MCC6330500.1 MFS transporter [Ignavibacteria bacterium]